MGILSSMSSIDSLDSEYLSTIPHKNSKGPYWKEYKYSAAVSRYTVDIQVSDGLSRDGLIYKDEFKEQIKLQLSQKIVEGLFKNDLINIYKECSIDPYEHEQVYRAELNVAKPNITNCLIDGWKYEVDGQNFTHEQVRKAIMNTFPEYYL